MGFIEKRKDKSIFYKVLIKIENLLLKIFLANKNSYRGVVFENNKFVYFPIPKVASTSLQNIFEEIDFKKEDTPKIKDFEKKYKNYYKFAFVRNPYDRVVSCYKDKILETNAYTGLALRQGFDIHMGFKEFVKEITKIPNIRADQHIKSQSFFLKDKNGDLIPDFVGKFENLERDYKKIMNNIGIKNPPKLLHKNKTQDKGKDYKDYYDEETRRLVQKRYKEDFELFGYNKEI